MIYYVYQYLREDGSPFYEKIRKANLGRKDDGRNAKISEAKKNKPWSQARCDAYNRKQGVML